MVGGSHDLEVDIEKILQKAPISQSDLSFNSISMKDCFIIGRVRASSNRKCERKGLLANKTESDIRNVIYLPLLLKV